MSKTLSDFVDEGLPRLKTTEANFTPGHNQVTTYLAFRFLKIELKLFTK